MNNFNPSFFQSWLYWRNKYTEPNKKPFSLLVEQMDNTYPLTASDWYYHNNGCPICSDSYAIVKIENKVVKCLCSVLETQDEISQSHNEVKTFVREAFTESFIFPKSLENSKSYLEYALRITKGFIANPKKWLLFHGSFGTGKTHLARIINTLLSPICLYISAKDVEGHTHAYRKTDTLEDFYSVLEYAPVLIIDDVGAEYGGPLVKSIIERIIDRRYERFPELPTVVITNLDSTKLFQYIPRTTDRLMDKAVVVPVEMNTQSFRHIPPGSRK